MWCNSAKITSRQEERLRQETVVKHIHLWCSAVEAEETSKINDHAQGCSAVAAKETQDHQLEDNQTRLGVLEDAMDQGDLKVTENDQEAMDWLETQQPSLSTSFGCVAHT